MRRASRARPRQADSEASGFYELGLAVDRSEKIAGTYAVLRKKLDDDDDAVLEVLTKNPGVLGCVPELLDEASAADIRRAASIADAADGVFGGARRFLQSTTWWDEGVANIAKAEDEAKRPKGASFDPLSLFGDRPGDEDDENEEEIQLPQIDIDGKPYLYDYKGAYNGIEHVLLTLEGVPVGVWDPETQEAEEVEFLDADEESE